MSEPILDWGEQALWDALVAVMTTLPTVLDRHLQQDGLTHFEYRILSALAAQPDERLLLSDLGRCTSGSLSRLSHVVTKLEGLGWVQRVRSESLRGTYAVLTAEGAGMRAAAAARYAALVRELLRGNNHQQAPVEFLDRLLLRIMPEAEHA